MHFSHMVSPQDQAGANATRSQSSIVAGAGDDDPNVIIMFGLAIHSGDLAEPEQLSHTGRQNKMLAAPRLAMQPGDESHSLMWEAVSSCPIFLTGTSFC
jgi:hypothetical protein